MGPTMDILGNTLATIGAAWICLLATIVLFVAAQEVTAWRKATLTLP